MLLGLALSRLKRCHLGLHPLLARGCSFFCGLDHSFEQNTVFKCCHRAAPLPVQRSYLSARSILAPGTGVGTVPISQLGMLRGSPCVTCPLWSKVPRAQGLQRPPGRWRGDKSFSLLGMRLEWLGAGALPWAALAWGSGGTAQRGLDRAGDGETAAPNLWKQINLCSPSPQGCHPQPCPMGALWALSWGNTRVRRDPNSPSP